MSKTTNKFAPEVREHAVRMGFDHERDSLVAPGSGGVNRGEGEDKERENRELRLANAIPRKASAYFLPNSSIIQKSVPFLDSTSLKHVYHIFALKYWE